MFFSCNDSGQGKKLFSNPDDLSRIKSAGKLVATTNSNSTDYFLYKGEPMGFQYELLKALCADLDVKLELIVENDIEKSFSLLWTSKCDILAFGLTTTGERNKMFDFTEPICQTKQVLVQYIKEKWRSLPGKALNDSLIRSTMELGGKTIHIQKGTAFKSRIENLSQEIGKPINIIEIDSLEVEEIIALVAEGKIEYTVCDENVALVNSSYYSNIDVKTGISFTQNIAWAVKKGSDSLRMAVNNWLVDFKTTKEFRMLYDKYYRNPRSAQMIKSEYHSAAGNSISKYDEMIKDGSRIIGWDWRLLASLICQESRFQDNLVSWAGASGLMQMMPATARKFGADSLSGPAQNINAGAKYIKYLEKTFFSDIPDPEQRIKFILASYNVGPGHILDARKLAKKYGKNDKLWDDHVEFFLLHKTNPKYYSDSLSSSGYCRGVEPCRFVDMVISRYEHYRNMVKE
ncbi:MAG: transporter substrate-binding domain-containing protein [Bacteroidota bacterium]